MKTSIVILSVMCGILALGCFYLGVSLTKAIAARNFWKKSSYHNDKCLAAERKRLEAAENLAAKSEEARLAQEDVIASQAEKLRETNATCEHLKKTNKFLAERLNVAEDTITDIGDSIGTIQTKINALRDAKNIIAQYKDYADISDDAWRKKNAGNKI